MRAWGGVWVEALEKGVSRPFTEQTGIAVRHDRGQRDPTEDLGRRGPEPGTPIHVNWDTSTNATKSALRGVTEDLGDLPNLKDMLPAAKPAGFDGVPLINMYSYVYVMAYRDEAFPGGAPDSWQVLLDPKFKGRIALYDDSIGFHPVAEILGGGTMADIPANMQPAWDFLAKLKQQSPLLGEDPTSPPGSRTARSTSPAPSSATPAPPGRTGSRFPGPCPRRPRSTPTGCGSPRVARRASSTGPRST